MNALPLETWISIVSYTDRQTQIQLREVDNLRYQLVGNAPFETIYIHNEQHARQFTDVIATNANELGTVVVNVVFGSPNIDYIPIENVNIILAVVELTPTVRVVTFDSNMVDLSNLVRVVYTNILATHLPNLQEVRLGNTASRNRENLQAYLRLQFHLRNQLTVVYVTRQTGFGDPLVPYQTEIQFILMFSRMRKLDLTQSRVYRKFEDLLPLIERVSVTEHLCFSQCRSDTENFFGRFCATLEIDQRRQLRENLQQIRTLEFNCEGVFSRHSLIFINQNMRHLNEIRAISEQNHHWTEAQGEAISGIFCSFLATLRIYDIQINNLSEAAIHLNFDRFVENTFVTGAINADDRTRKFLIIRAGNGGRFSCYLKLYSSMDAAEIVSRTMVINYQDINLARMCYALARGNPAIANVNIFLRL